MHLGQSGAGFHTHSVRLHIKEGDVVGQAAGEQHVFLHHAADAPAHIGRPNWRTGMPP